MQLCPESFSDGSGRRFSWVTLAAGGGMLLLLAQGRVGQSHWKRRLSSDLEVLSSNGCFPCDDHQGHEIGASINMHLIILF